MSETKFRVDFKVQLCEVNWFGQACQLQTAELLKS